MTPITNSVESLRALNEEFPETIASTEVLTADLRAMVSLSPNEAPNEEAQAYMVLTMLGHRLYEAQKRPETFMNAYQQEAMETARTSGGFQSTRQGMLATRALGIIGEAGEVAELIKKHVGFGHELPREKIVKELGDVLWYVATLASAFDIPLDEIAAVNIEKLRRRYPKGFSEEASRNRVDENPGAPNDVLSSGASI